MCLLKMCFWRCILARLLWGVFERLSALQNKASNGGWVGATHCNHLQRAANGLYGAKL
jgi:hypothetical protein